MEGTGRKGRRKAREERKKRFWKGGGRRER